MSATANGSGRGEARASPDPDAHGQAALLLVESLLHGLIERTVIDTGGAIDIVETAAEVKLDLAGSGVESRATTERSLRLLVAIRDSLRLDLDPEASPLAGD